MNEVEVRSPSFDPDKIQELSTKLNTGSEAVQLQAISELTNYGDEAVDLLINFLLQRQAAAVEPSYLDGKVYQILLKLNSAKATTLLENNYPQGLVRLESESGIDYAPLQTLLAQQDFQAADQLTAKKMCEAVGSAAVERGWLYFTDIHQIPSADLRTINNLWLIYSEGKFGFSVQRKIWLNLGKNWEKLWLQIGWKKSGKFTRYPGEFIWDTAAPRGHLPLSNQIRGNKTISAIFSHPLWQS